VNQSHGPTAARASSSDITCIDSMHRQLRRIRQGDDRARQLPSKSDCSKGSFRQQSTLFPVVIGLRRRGGRSIAVTERQEAPSFGRSSSSLTVCLLSLCSFTYNPPSVVLHECGCSLFSASPRKDIPNSRVLGIAQPFLPKRSCSSSPVLYEGKCYGSRENLERYAGPSLPQSPRKMKMSGSKNDDDVAQPKSKCIAIL
jgi:hypothetical protein